MLFRMVPKRQIFHPQGRRSFRAVLFRMVPKHGKMINGTFVSFRAVLFRMVPKLIVNVI